MLIEPHIQYEWPSTFTRQQYAVQLTYTDGRVTQHIRPSRQSAETMVAHHRQAMIREPGWRVLTAELVVRDIDVVMNDWREPRDDD